MPERDPVQVRCGIAGGLLELRKCLLFHGDDRHVVAEAARALEHKEGKPAVAGDQADAGHGKSKDVSLTKPAARCTADKFIIGIGREMGRLTGRGVLLCALLALASACGSSTPTTPTPPPLVTDTFAVTLAQNGAITHTFSIS